MRTLPLLLVLLIAGCGLGPRMLERQRATIQDKPAAYQSGYMHGCESILSESDMVPKEDAIYRRDDARMKADAEYALGWNDGHWKCRLH